MSISDSNSDQGRNTDRAAAETAEVDRRRDDTLNRIRTALLRDRLAVTSLSDENTGTDPYNSGVHRALAKAHVWGKRPR
jgi:hypothetical protein